MSAHLDDGENDEFEDALLLAAQNNVISFDMTKRDNYSLATEYSAELLAGSQFGRFPHEELEITTEAIETDELSYKRVKVSLPEMSIFINFLFSALLDSP